MEITRRLLLTLPLALLARAAGAAEKPIKVFRWVDIGGAPYVKGRPATVDELRKAHGYLVADAEKHLPSELRPTAKGNERFHEIISNVTFDSKAPMVFTVKENEEHTLMVGEKGKVYRYVVTVPSRWKKDRSRLYFRIVYIHDGGEVEEWRVYQGCANLTYSRYHPRGKPCIPHGPREEVELKS